MGTSRVPGVSRGPAQRDDAFANESRRPINDGHANAWTSNGPQIHESHLRGAGEIQAHLALGELDTGVGRLAEAAIQLDDAETLARAGVARLPRTGILRRGYQTAQNRTGRALPADLEYPL